MQPLITHPMLDFLVKRSSAVSAGKRHARDCCSRNSSGFQKTMRERIRRLGEGIIACTSEKRLDVSCKGRLPDANIYDREPRKW